MTHTTLAVNLRKTLGNQVRKLRRDDILPAVVYGKKNDSLSIECPYREFIKVFKETGKTHVLDISIADGSTLPCLIHNLDIHPVTGNIRHVDFLAVDLKVKVVASVPLKFINESPAVKQGIGILITPLEEVEILSLPDNIPEAIEVDLSSLTDFDSTIRVEDLNIPSSSQIQLDSDIVIASIVAQSEEEETNKPVTEPTVQNPS